MILLTHMIFGAAIGSKINSVPLAIVLAFLSHYFLDIFPHIEYPIPNIIENKWKESLPDFLKVALDFCLGLAIIFIFSKNQPVVYLYAFAAIIPDGLTMLNKLFKNKILEFHNKIHTEKIHYLTKKKNFSNFWRISIQALAIFISIILLTH